MKRKLGILTYWGVPNYGAWVQSYALNNIVRQIVGDEDEVKHINYLNDVHWDSYYKENERLDNSFNYTWDEIPHTERLTSDSLEKTFFDVIITGSDAIWAFSIPEMGNDVHLIGNNLNTNKLIAYATSFAVTTEESCLYTWIKNGLYSYNRIMVRDLHSQSVIEKIDSKIRTEIVLDPVLLWDFLNDNNIKLPKYKDYIVVYGTNFSDEFKCNVIKHAREKGYKLISVGYVNDWCDMSLRMIELRGMEWLGMFKNAELVVTSMFHGLMCGLAFEKNIKFYQTEFIKNKSQYLIDKLNLPNHKVSFDEEINYSKIKGILNDMRKNSLALLTESLEAK